MATFEAPIALCSALFLFLATPSDLMEAHISTWHGLLMNGVILPWALYVLLLPHGARLTCTWFMDKCSASRCLLLALASILSISPSTILILFVGHLPFVNPNSLA